MVWPPFLKSSDSFIWSTHHLLVEWILVLSDRAVIVSGVWGQRLCLWSDHEETHSWKHLLRTYPCPPLVVLTRNPENLGFLFDQNWQWVDSTVVLPKHVHSYLSYSTTVCINQSRVSFLAFAYSRILVPCIHVWEQRRCIVGGSWKDFSRVFMQFLPFW
jgi:hypothetical protein